MNASYLSSYYHQPNSQYRFEDFLSYVPKDSIDEFMALEKPLGEMCMEELWVRYGCVLKMKQITEKKMREMNLSTSIQKRIMITKLVSIIDREYMEVNSQMSKLYYRK
jgi:hypothetical protein